MRVLYLPAFVRDLKRLQGAREYARIRRLAFAAAPASVGLEELAQVKKLYGQEGAYRIRLGVNQAIRVGPLLFAAFQFSRRIAPGAS